MDASRSVVWRGVPPETPRTHGVQQRVGARAWRRSALSPSRPISTPLSSPATTRDTEREQGRRQQLARRRRPASCVTMTTTSETEPATDRSMPPCMTTRVWPSATIARTAANGSMPSTAPLLRLLGAKSIPASTSSDQRDHDGDQAARQTSARGARRGASADVRGHAASSVGGSCWSAAVHQLLGRTVQRPVVVHKGYTRRKCGQ